MERIEFKNLPDQTTPLSAQNLNQLQTNVETEINNSGAVVSATEPTGSAKKKIWKQHSKNLFDKNEKVTSYGVYIINGSLNTASLWTSTNFFKVKKNTTYCINSASVGDSRNYGVAYYDKDFNFVSGTAWDDLGYSSVGQQTNINFTSPNNDSVVYGRICVRTTDTNFNTLQIEQGTTGTAYENYINDKEYILNANNVYEEFNKKLEDDMFYKTGDTITYIRDNIINGYVTGNGTQLELIVYTDKRLDKISVITPTKTEGIGRSATGYIDNANSWTDYTASGSSFTTLARKISNNSFLFRITKSSAFANLTNNTPITMLLRGETTIFTLT